MRERHDYVEPAYSTGLRPGTLAVVHERAGTVHMSQSIRRDRFADGTWGAAIEPPHVRLVAGSQVIVVARPMWGNPWEGAHMGLAYVVVSNLQRAGWVWASGLDEVVP